MQGSIPATGFAKKSAAAPATKAVSRRRAALPHRNRARSRATSLPPIASRVQGKRRFRNEPGDRCERPPPRRREAGPPRKPRRRNDRTRRNGTRRRPRPPCARRRAEFFRGASRNPPAPPPIPRQSRRSQPARARRRVSVASARESGTPSAVASMRLLRRRFCRKVCKKFAATTSSESCSRHRAAVSTETPPWERLD